MGQLRRLLTKRAAKHLDHTYALVSQGRIIANHNRKVNQKQEVIKTEFNECLRNTQKDLFASINYMRQ